MKTDMLESLLLLTARFLELLVKQYHSGVIDHITFKECAIIKIPFIQNNKSNLEQTEQINYIESVLEETEKVFTMC